MVNPVCLECRFFEISLMDPHKGLCRRNAPPVTLGADSEDAPPRDTWWPVVYDDDWCGEFAEAQA